MLTDTKQYLDDRGFVREDKLARMKIVEQLRTHIPTVETARRGRAEGDTRHPPARAGARLERQRGDRQGAELPCRRPPLCRAEWEDAEGAGERLRALLGAGQACSRRGRGADEQVGSVHLKRPRRRRAVLADAGDRSCGEGNSAGERRHRDGRQADSDSGDPPAVLARKAQEQLALAMPLEES